MLTRRAMLAALWIAASTAFPALAVLDPVVDRVVDRVPDRPVFVTPNTPAPNVPSPIKADPGLAKRYDDGKVYYGACIDRGQCKAAPVRIVGWWQRGPIRRWASGLRLFRWRRC